MQRKHQESIPQSQLCPAFNGGASSRGFLDTAADCVTVTGWAYDPVQPNTPIMVDIYGGNSLVATVAANIFRQDLFNAGIGNGSHGFIYTVPASLRNGQTRTIRAQVSDRNIVLTGSSGLITCP